jgi:uncharacterized membrane protein YfcA
VQLRLVGIGLAAGFFGALFGVGGGIVIVPMLLGVARFTVRPAMATSLAAIGLIAFEGVIFYGIHGDLRPVDAVVLGLPAAAGAAIGAAVQQRLASRTLTFAFSALLFGVGIRLLV